MTHQTFEIGLIDNTPTIFDLNAFDKGSWNRIAHRVGTAYNAKDFPGNPEQDAYFSLKNSNPQFLAEPGQGLEVLQEIFKRGMETPAFRSLKQQTVGNEVMSAAVSSTVIEGAFSSIPDEVKEQAQEQAQKQEQAEQDLQAAMNAMTFAREAEAQNNPDLAEAFKKEATEKERSGNQAQHEANQAGQEIAEFFESSGDIVADKFGKACKEAGQEARKISAIMQAYGEASGTNPKDFSPGVIDGLMQLITQHPDIMFFIDCLGWAKDTVGTIERKLANARFAVVRQRTQELDLEDVDDEENMALTGGMGSMLKADVLYRAVEDLVIHDVYEGTSPEGSGPIVKVTDRSGSMGSLIPGTNYTNHAMSVAITFALMSHAQKTGRRVVDISFGGRGDFTTCDSATMTPESFFNHLSYNATGGTQPEKPLLEAVKIITEEKLNADIWFITDGAIPAPSNKLKGELKQCKEDTGSKTVSTIIGNFDSHKAEEISDATTFIDDLWNDRSKIEKILKEIL